jgi:hypothetical protein
MPAHGKVTASLVLHGPNVNPVTHVFAEEPISTKRQTVETFTKFQYESKLEEFIRML